MNPIEFEAISKADPSIIISGITYLEDIDDESPLQFYDQTNQLSWYIPKNPFDMDTQMQSYTNYEALKEAFNCDDLLLQYLADYATENKTIIRGNYILKINPGDDNMKDTNLKFIKTEEIREVIVNINNEVKKYADIGGTNRIIRIVIYDNLIMLQAEDNGDRVIYHISQDYPYTTDLINELKLWCNEKDLIYSNLNK